MNNKGNYLNHKFNTWFLFGEKMKLKYLLFAVISILLYYPLLRLGFYEKVVFEDGILQNQFMAHKGLQEIYMHIYSGFILFVVCVISVVVLYEYFKDSKYTWKPVLAGILSTGLIGLGEGAEHLFATFGHEVFHYTHMIGSPIAIYFLYVGAKEYSMQFREGGKPMGTRAILILMFSVFVISLILASVSRAHWDPAIERPFIYVIAIPLVILSFLTLKEAFEQIEKQKMLMHYISLIAISVMLLNIVILLGRDADIVNNAYIYIVTFGFQNILLIVNATFILAFTISMRIMMTRDEGSTSLSSFGRVQSIR